LVKTSPYVRLILALDIVQAFVIDANSHCYTEDLTGEDPSPGLPFMVPV
jgi:hypothetical protein